MVERWLNSHVVVRFYNRKLDLKLLCFFYMVLPEQMLVQAGFYRSQHDLCEKRYRATRVVYIMQKHKTARRSGRNKKVDTKI